MKGEQTSNYAVMGNLNHRAILWNQTDSRDCLMLKFLHLLLPYHEKAYILRNYLHFTRITSSDNSGINQWKKIILMWLVKLTLADNVTSLKVRYLQAKIKIIVLLKNNQ